MHPFSRSSSLFALYHIWYCFSHICEEIRNSRGSSPSKDKACSPCSMASRAKACSPCSSPPKRSGGTGPVQHTPYLPTQACVFGLQNATSEAAANAANGGVTPPNAARCPKLHQIGPTGPAHLPASPCTSPCISLHLRGVTSPTRIMPEG